MIGNRVSVKSSGMAPGLVKQSKICKWPTPGTGKEGKCPAVARGGGGAGRRCNWLMHNPNRKENIKAFYVLLPQLIRSRHFMVELRTLWTFVWNIKPPIKFFHFMLHLSHSRAVELPPSTNANQRSSRGFYVPSCSRPTYSWQRPAKGISLISTHIKALRGEILKTLWNAMKH